jgi:hypothetical protein
LTAILLSSFEVSESAIGGNVIKDRLLVAVFRYDWDESVTSKTYGMFVDYDRGMGGI